MKALLFVLIFSSTAAGAQEIDREPNTEFPETAPPHEVLIHPHREQRDNYLFGTFGPPGLLEAALGAGLGQWLDTPPEWEQTRAGYARRFATEYSESAIGASTKYVLARLRDEDPSFRPCECSGIHRRTWHAIISPLAAYRFDDGRMQFSIARVGGTATSSFVSGVAWKPGTPTAASLVGHLGADLLTAMGVDLLREFFFHHQPAQ